MQVATSHLIVACKLQIKLARTAALLHVHAWVTSMAFVSLVKCVKINTTIGDPHACCKCAFNVFN